MKTRREEEQMATDPVCGMQVSEAEARERDLTADYAGREYFFCSAACQRSFQEDPSGYVGKVERES
jgi:Cu+-exporting ATPase